MIQKNYFSKEDCLGIIHYAEALERWKDIDVYGEYKIIKFEPSIELTNTVKDYCKEHIGIEVSGCEMRVFKYELGDYIERHKDRVADHKRYKDFLYNINVKLNDEYEGGEFYLKDNIIESNIGDVYHYNSEYYHEVKPVTKGIRYTGLFSIKEEHIIKSNKLI